MNRNNKFSIMIKKLNKDKYKLVRIRQIKLNPKTKVLLKIFLILKMINKKYYLH